MVKLNGINGDIGFYISNEKEEILDMAIKIPKRDTISGKIKEYNELDYSEENYEKFYSDAYKILIGKWDEYVKNSNLSENYKNVFKYAYTSYLKKLKKMDFINPENITYIFEILDKNITSFCSRDNGDYAAWDHGSGQIVINPTNLDGKTQEYIIRIIYHEITHALINRKISGLNPILEKYENRERTRIKKNPPIKIKNRSKNIGGFFHELLAEEMAQQLWYEEDNRPEKTTQPPGLIGFQPDRVIYSNYGPGYNRCYQQLGEEFAKNLTNINTPENNTNEKRLKVLLKLCLTPDVNILDTIYNNYCNPDEIHKAKLFDTMGYIVGRAGKGGRDDVEGNKYLVNMRNYMNSGNIYSDRELFRVLENDREMLCSRITPQNISNVTRASIRINPGEVSRKVEDSRIHIKTGIDKNNPNRNK